jgi:hypothetical protein
VVHEDPPHEIGGERKEVRAALPVDGLLVDQPDERLVHERRALDGVVVPFAPQMPLRE